MTAWPTSLPSAPLIDRFRETAPDTVLRTAMDEGPAKLRRRTTAGVRMLKLAYILDRTQADTLDGFYLTDLSGGALAFDFTHPRTSEGIVCRFTAPPEYTALNGNYFRAEISLEVLP
jgi:hypothetical protein